MAMGVDDAVIVRDPFEGEADERRRGASARGGRSVDGPYDLLVCGFASDDGYTWQVGPRLAERLDLPFVSYARDVRVTDGALEVDQDYGDRVRTVQAAAARHDRRRRGVLRSSPHHAARGHEGPEAAGERPRGRGRSRICRWKRSRSDRAFIEVSRRGVVVPRRQSMLAGQDIAELADRLIDALVEENVLAEAG